MIYVFIYSFSRRYFLITRGKNMCGLAACASFPEVWYFVQMARKWNRVQTFSVWLFSLCTGTLYNRSYISVLEYVNHQNLLLWNWYTNIYKFFLWLYDTVCDRSKRLLKRSLITVEYALHLILGVSPLRNCRSWLYEHFKGGVWINSSQW